LVRRATLDLKRVKEAEYMNELVSSQFRVEPNQFALALLNASDGFDYDFSKAAQKEVVVCGLPSDEIIEMQDALLALDIYPDRLELTTVAMLGLLADYLAFTKSKTPLLVLELGTETTHSFIVTAGGLDAARPIPQGFESMIPVVQKELGLKDEESAKKLFYSNTFDFTGMGSALIKKLVKELQSSIGFYEVQTGQSIGQVLCTQVPPKMTWIDGAIAGMLGVAGLQADLQPWLQARGVTISEEAAIAGRDLRWLGLLGLIVQNNNAPV
jgi:Tfp pilus assembly PilM family ATPase